MITITSLALQHELIRLKHIAYVHDGLSVGQLVDSGVAASNLYRIGSYVLFDARESHVVEIGSEQFFLISHEDVLGSVQIDEKT